MTEFQFIATPHLSGCCVKVQNRTHGLFVVRRRPRPEAPARAMRPAATPEREGDAVAAVA